jgi:L-ascorbate metabolism protein UlaG (beta-lactamase superfamily)
MCSLVPLSQALPASHVRRIRCVTLDTHIKGPANRVAVRCGRWRIGWAGYVVTTEAGTRLVVDPFLTAPSQGPYSSLPNSPVTVDELADADVVAVTHAGYDHRAQALDVTPAGNAVLVCGTALYGAALDAGVKAERCAGIVSGCTFATPHTKPLDTTIVAGD